MKKPLRQFNPAGFNPTGLAEHHEDYFQEQPNPDGPGTILIPLGRYTIPAGQFSAWGPTVPTGGGTRTVVVGDSASGGKSEGAWRTG